jgi:hypothetical protein
MTGSADSRRRSLRRRGWALLGAAAVFAAVAVVLAFRSPSAQEIPVARGVVDGSFHPIAGRFVADGTELDDCGSKDVRCLEQGFGNLAYRQGPKAALALFDRRRSADKTVAVDCHRIAHMIGSAALAHFHGNVALTYSRGSASCASGYYHGILERAFARVRSEAGLIRVARTLCRGADLRRRGFLDYQCTHGLGHGLMMQTGYDLPTALAVCSRLQARWDEVSCTGGAFMENGSSVYGLRSRWLKDDDPVYPCQAVKLRHRASCYLRVTTQMLRVNRFDWPETAALCRAVGESWRRYCFRSYGRDTVHYAGGKIQPILRLCRLAGGGEGECLYGAARTVADRDARADAAAALCHAAPAQRRDSCFGGVGLVIGLLQATPATRAETCRRLAAESAPACARAAAREVRPDGSGAWG